VAGWVANQLPSGSLATTAVSAFELLSGARTTDAARTVAELLAAIAILDFDEPAARSAAEARRKLEESGTPIGMADYLIAGICLSRGIPLATRNRVHFDRVEGLSVLNPTP
jgi:tRNA(fMet)-specific endonuclease VapC